MRKKCFFKRVFKRAFFITLQNYVNVDFDKNEMLMNFSKFEFGNRMGFDMSGYGARIIKGHSKLS